MPFITLSRMFGSGGSEVAERAARALGWALLDNDVVAAVAERSGMTRAEVTAQDERVPPLVARLAAALSLGTPESIPAVTGEFDATPRSPEERVLEITKRVIEEAVQRGPAVFVGRGAQFLLAERTDALHVFCYAPRPALVARAVRELGVDPAEAERVVADNNRQREQYVRRHWGRDWRDIANYDLCLNTASLGLDGAAALVVDAARARLGAGG